MSLQLPTQATLSRRERWTITAVVKTGGWWFFLLKSSAKMNKRKAVPPWGRANDKKHWLSERNNDAERRKRNRETESGDLRELHPDREKKKSWVVIGDLIAVVGTFNVENVRRCPLEKKLSKTLAENRPQTLVLSLYRYAVVCRNIIFNWLLSLVDFYVLSFL